MLCHALSCFWFLRPSNLRDFFTVQGYMIEKEKKKKYCLKE